ncbi:MAG: AAA family ATPase [Planctomycetota bacterium]|nr:AAA family ATPase [Planctomycetota bacterium]
MIREVTIRRFKRFEEVTFSIPGHVVVAGPNNCGKTTLLQAIATFAFALDQWRRRNDFQRHGGHYTKVPISRPAFYSVPLKAFDLLWKDRQYEGTIEIEIKFLDGSTVTMELRADSTEQIYVRPLPDAAPGKLRELQPSAVYVPSMTGLSTDEPVYREPKIQQLLGQGKPGDVLRNLLVMAHEGNSWESLVAGIQRLFGFTLLPPDATVADIVAEYKVNAGGPRFDIASAGSGFQQVLMLLTFLHARPASVLLLDEPDAHLHVLLQDSIYHELQAVAIAQKSQLIIATHSEVIINSVAPEQLCMLFNKPQLLNSVADRTRLAEAMRVLTNMDVMLAQDSLGVLFTEDYTDRDILLAWAKTLGHPLVKLLETNRILTKSYVTEHRVGASGIKSRDYYDKLLLINDSLPGLELVDGDAHSHIQSQPITGTGFQRLRWNRYEIESYLFHPTAIARFVGEKVGSPTAAAPHLRDLQTYFQENWPPAFMNDPLRDLDFLKTTKARTNLIPPALDAAGLAGMPYTEFFQIAAVMTPDEIHPEVKEKLDLIQKAFNL